MTPVMQTIVDAEKGNCMQASIASLLDMELEQVPNLIEMDEDIWPDIFVDWLWANGYEYFGEMPGSYVSTIPDYTEGVRGYVLVKGTSNYPRGHMVVYDLDGKLAHDPAPAGIGVFKVEAYWIIEPRKDQ